MAILIVRIAAGMTGLRHPECPGKSSSENDPKLDLKVGYRFAPRGCGRLEPNYSLFPDTASSFGDTVFFVTGTVSHA
jgi:hypothetical protein